MTLTPEAIGFGVLILTNVGALIYNAATVNERLKVIPVLVEKAEDHGERIIVLETNCEARHGTEVQT